jgi:catechol 2,3-dioxygenase-like lactoylglutathione lyase family enzyme
MLDHITISVSDIAAAVAFYDKCLPLLGISKLVDVAAERSGTTAYAGYGEGEKPYFWIGQRSGPITPIHVAFLARDRATVDAFHQHAILSGGRDNGEPGVRPHYHPNYYGAFVLDPDGHNIEAVCHESD